MLLAASIAGNASYPDRATAEQNPAQAGQGCESGRVRQIREAQTSMNSKIGCSG
jgi:hypothetical protein